MIGDVLNNEEATAHVKRLYALGETSPKLICEEMLDLSLDKGSKVGMLVMVAVWLYIDSVSVYCM